eukprot:TRINITY_DN5592_c0_g2_i2.p1 TRINITY_DN5592_c0_g2~~TRINITY_DN5592_c0_g2_i2.p1  ORF type:complete len:224 (-),score=41.03 TRINITY_DN5592_c0_g2_i2:2567-3238(-)
MPAPQLGIINSDLMLASTEACEAAPATTAQSDAAPAATAPAATAAAPEHLVVLCHGIFGSPGDLAYLEKAVKREGMGRVLVLNARVNTGKTRDGIASGGTRVAEAVREAVSANPSFRYISVAGHSLGGLYLRYAVHLLYDATAERCCIAGLEPVTFMTIATPHLGVRRYTWGVTYPRAMLPLAAVLFGQTGRELFLTDGAKGQEPLMKQVIVTDSLSQNGIGS